MEHQSNKLIFKRLGIHTQHEHFAYMREDCHVCISEGFEALTRIRVIYGKKSIVASLNVIRTGILKPGEISLSESAIHSLGIKENEVVGETYVRILSDVKDKCVVLVATLHQPDEKLLPIYFLSHTAKSLGAKCTCLVVPYLAYMRQDRVFKPGEGVTSDYFGKLISGFADSLITVDPHLHRRGSLTEVYQIPAQVVHAASAISNWIKENIENPVLIGPDNESEQWVSKVAANAGAPFIVLEKTRHGDRDVEVSIPQVGDYKNHTPVLVDDIISTACTMIETVGHLKKARMKASVCIGVHAVFAGNAYENLEKAGAEVVTCNTIPHESNQIDLGNLLAEKIVETMRHV